MVRSILSRRPVMLAGAAALLAVGGGAGAIAVASSRPAVTMAPATPVAIRAMADDSIVTVRGRVVELFGNKAVIADASGRALIDLGREGEDNALVAVGQAVTVQGRFDRGFVRAAFLVDAAGKVTALGPIGRPPHEGGPPRDGRPGPHGPGRGGPDGAPGRCDDRGGPVAPAAAPASAPASAATPST